MFLPKSLRTNVENRKALVGLMRQELVGPAPAGPAENIPDEPVAESWADARRPRRQADGEEVLTSDRPGIRYGVGVLYPAGSAAPEVMENRNDDEHSSEDGESEDGESEPDDQEPLKSPEITGNDKASEEAENDDFDLSTANTLRPASMAISFVAELGPDTELVIDITGGYYQSRDVRIDSGGGQPQPLDSATPTTGTAETSASRSGIVADAAERPSDVVADDASAGAPASRARNRSTKWWLRTPLDLSIRISSALLAASQNSLTRKESTTAGPLELEVSVLSRPYQPADGIKAAGPELRLVTVSLTNRTTVPLRLPDTACLFQAGFVASVQERNGSVPKALIHPYPLPKLPQPVIAPVVQDAPEAGDSDQKIRQHEANVAREAAQEEESLRLLYRNQQTWATGHGCAADWMLNDDKRTALSVSATVLPCVELPAVTPDIRRPDGTPLSIPMKRLAGLEPGTDNGYADLTDLISEYRNWISHQQKIALALPEEYQAAAERHLEQATACADRMDAGLQLLQSETEGLVGIAFRLANHAIMLQQSRNNTKRLALYDPLQMQLSFNKPIEAVTMPEDGSDRGNWRAFQIAFLLMNLAGVADPTLPDREMVELIWFPTGGGKTEAYLGLAAFAIFLRRLTNPQNKGVEVMMRYTLRLLTAQQFQRAARLVCAMEYLRIQDRRARQGPLQSVDKSFTIGIWVGGSTTPLHCTDAVTAYNAIKAGNHAETGFLLTQCPWCAAQMGDKIPDRAVPLGLSQTGGCVSLHCPDPVCLFHNQLPAEVIDDKIYASPPDILIGTVDKFAQLAWNDGPRSMFGLESDGGRENNEISPPGLIIQDELHLISGPLGTMVGLYEPLIEDLCTDYRDASNPIRPKIISSTATIRRYESQIRALYARGNVTLFPPPGLDNLDSFFAQQARTQAVGEEGEKLADASGRPLLLDTPGRMYVGVHAPGLPSLQTTQVRTFSAVSAAPVRLIPESAPDWQKFRDPWWTLLVFYNSLRELGGAVSLMQSDIPEYLRGMQRRQGFSKSDAGEAQPVRYLNHVRELTSRISSAEVAEAISSLEVSVGTPDARIYDFCLASNIIEVGVDINRLSVMAVVGQPKNTAQYIQVTGRVGRKADERPGLVITLFSPSKPRDRSHFEKFRSYHERLYAQVEPTGLTPFSPPALTRALHAMMAAFVRQYGNHPVANPEQIPQFDALLGRLRRVLLHRAGLVDPATIPALSNMFDKRVSEWSDRLPERWGTQGGNFQQTDLMYPAGQDADPSTRWSWPTPTSMRNVDASCELDVTPLAD